jgi:leucine dehydrogenase
MAGGVFERMSHRDHEQVVHCYDRATGLRAIIAIHSTVLGPSLGGCRMWPFASEEEALEDVLRLSRGMTYKAAVAGLNLGGGKAVIIGDSKKDKNEALFRAFGRFVHSLGGRYLTAEDVGTSVRDLEWVRMETPYATGISPVLGGSGDPSIMTAWGVYTGIKASTQERFQTTDLSPFRVAIQGLGNTGYWLAKYLAADKVRLVVTDLDEDRVGKVAKDFGAEAVAPDAIYDADADIFAPCAMGAVVNDRTLPRMKFKIIAGAANNVLEVEERHGPMVREKGILYAPDFVINCGGLINVANELDVYNPERVKRQVENVFETLLEIFAISRKESIPTSTAANRVAEARIERIARLKRTWVGPQESQRRPRERN